MRAAIGAQSAYDRAGCLRSDTRAAAKDGLNPKTVSKWRRRAFVHDAAMGSKEPRSTVLTTGGEAVIAAFHRYTLLPLDDCLYALQATIPPLSRSTLHRCLQCREISR